MLPNFPTLKSDLNDRLLTFLTAQAHKHLGPGLNEIPRSTIHEGKRQVMVRPNGEVEEMKIQSVSAEFQINTDELINLSFPDILQRYDEMAKEMAQQQAQHVFETIDETVAKVGNVVNAAGKGFSAELLLSILEKLHMDFDSDGTPHLPQIIMGSQAGDVKAAIEKEFKDNPALARQYDLLMQRKYEEWRAREANRSLAG